MHLRSLLDAAGPRTAEQLQLNVKALLEHPSLAGTPTVLSQKHIPFLNIPSDRICDRRILVPIIPLCVCYYIIICLAYYLVIVIVRYHGLE